MSDTVRVRIAVAYDEHGNLGVAWGDDGEEWAKEFYYTDHELERLDMRFAWVEVDLPLPQHPFVEGKVVDE